jgi:hypothetical protein
MDRGFRQLACAITYQAVKDYCGATVHGRRAILKDLRSSWMDFITNGTSLTVADELEKHPTEIEARMRKMEGK